MNNPHLITMRGLVFAALLAAGQALSQNYGINWFTMDGGGGTSTGGVYAISGTIGQPDAALPSDQNGFPVIASGGGYTLVGGFWTVIQQDGAPRLNIQIRAGELVLSWPADSSGAFVQSATQLAPGSLNWARFGSEPIRVGNEFQLIIGPALTPPNPIRFFRLVRP
jgi:hypothetical protein